MWNLLIAKVSSSSYIEKEIMKTENIKILNATRENKKKKRWRKANEFVVLFCGFFYDAMIWASERREKRI